jgi:predicted amidohydrolase YtcJ
MDWIRILQTVVVRGMLLTLGITLAGCDTGSVAAPQKTVAAAEVKVTLAEGARIYAFDAAGSRWDDGAIAFSDTGEIIAVGKRAELQKQYGDARRVDLSGKTVLPGLIDAHGHLFGLARSFTRADLTGTRSRAEVIERLKNYARRVPAGNWLLGRGWDQNDWPEQAFPDRADLDAEFPDRPVWLVRIDGHAAWANSQALAQADVDLSGDWQPVGGRIQRDAEGRATGILIDGALDLVEPHIPAPGPELMDAALDLATATLAKLGLTGVHDPGVGLDVIDLYRSKISQGKFPLRVYAMADGVGATLDWLCAEGPLDDPSGRLLVRSVKLYADGALGSRGAALLSDYSDEPGNRGLLFSSAENLEADLRRVAACGLQACVHAIGDRANHVVLDAFASMAGDFPDNPGRHRIEHAQILHPDDIPRFAALGVIASMQPTHATSDMYWAGERLGPDRLAGAYAWASLLHSGAALAFGSDFPVEEVNPMLGIYAAVTRQDLEQQPPGGWLPEQVLDRETAVRGFTIEAARAAFMEDRIGSLEVGKRADFIVLDRDLMTVPAGEIPEVVVEQTWLDGQAVYQR